MLADKLSNSELNKFRSIKAATLGGFNVSASDKQWIVDLFKRFNEPMRAGVHAVATQQGFDTNGVVLQPILT